MTRTAGGIHWLKGDIWLAVETGIFVAGPAGYFDVSAVEFKFRITVMVEFFGFPAIGTMTSRTIGVFRFT